MKPRLLFISLILFSSAELFSQAKIGYVDSKVIIESMQDARDAQANLDNVVQQWKKELQQISDSLAIMKEDYEKKKLILTENIRKKKEDEIAALAKKIDDYKQAKFGENGDYFLKQNELMKPVQDKVFKAIQDVAKEGNYDFVFDRNSDIILLYMNEKYDLTQKVIKKIESM